MAKKKVAKASGEKKATALLRAKKLGVQRFAEQLVKAHDEIGRIRGILEGAAGATSLADVGHRVKSVLGHKNAVKHVITTLGELFVGLYSLDL